jgi:hypothetical protein
MRLPLIEIPIADAAGNFSDSQDQLQPSRVDPSRGVRKSRIEVRSANQYFSIFRYAMRRNGSAARAATAPSDTISAGPIGAVMQNGNILEIVRNPIVSGFEGFSDCENSIHSQQ